MPSHTTKRLKVLFVIPSLGQGGAEAQVVSLINGINEQSFERHLVCFEERQSLLPNLDQKAITFKYIPRQRKFDLSLASRIAQYIDQHDIDVVHATLLISGYVAWNAVKQSAKKPSLIVAIHSTKSRSWKDELATRTIYQAPLRNAKKVVFVSDTQKSLWTTKFPWIKTNSTSIHNGIDSDRFVRQDHIVNGQRLLDKHQINPDAPLISCIAAFRPEKNHDLLVQALSQIDQDFTVCFAGDGDGRKAVEQQVDKLKLRKKCRFLGRLDDVRPLLAVSTITVLASSSEAFSMAMLESLAMEVPMLATDVGGMKEAIKPNQTGQLVKPGDIEALKNGIVKLLIDVDQLEQMGTKGAHLVRERFTRRHMIDRTESEIKKAWSRGDSRP